MGFFLFLISLVLIGEGVMMILSPKKVMKWANDILKVKDPKMLGLIPLVLGILLLFAASSSAIGWLIVLLGIAEIAKAVYLFITPLAKVKSHPFFKLSDNNLRGLGILVLVLGVIVFISRV